MVICITIPFVLSVCIIWFCNCIKDPQSCLPDRLAYQNKGANESFRLVLGRLRRSNLDR